MRLLVLGGTKFLGRHVVDEALRRGHEVTMFNRGQTAPGLFPEAEEIRGDRDGGLALLGSGRWFAVIDTSGYVPRMVRDSARLLADHAEHYVFVSSESVYAGNDVPEQDETAPVGTLDDTSVEEITEDTYGPLKALCEQEVERAFPGRSLSARFGLIVGPFDPTDRFTYWVRRVAAGGEVLVPGPPEAPLQVIDARDGAAWLVSAAEARTAGTFNVTGPDRPFTFSDLVETCRAAADGDAEFTWVDPDFLLEQDVEPWSDLPLWLPGREYAGFMRRDVRRAIREGLQFRPLAETVQDTLRWDSTRDVKTLSAGIDADREAELLRAWWGRAAG
jgi:2'-hydroxyisoflavone reductase